MPIPESRHRCSSGVGYSAHRWRNWEDRRCSFEPMGVDVVQGPRALPGRPSHRLAATVPGHHDDGTRGHRGSVQRPQQWNVLLHDEGVAGSSHDTPDTPGAD